jgi:hypothetical protein
MKNVSNASILDDLEFRGIDDFIREMADGLVVPTCFVERIKSIIKENYDIDLVAKPGVLDALSEGVFCLMPYNDTSVTLVSSY